MTTWIYNTIKTSPNTKIPPNEVSAISCARCYQRKQKCDKKLPKCSRCQTSSHPCHYVRNRDNFINMNDSNTIFGADHPKTTKRITSTPKNSKQIIQIHKEKILTNNFLIQLTQSTPFQERKSEGWLKSDIPMSFMQVIFDALINPNEDQYSAQFVNQRERELHQIIYDHRYWNELYDLFMTYHHPYYPSFNIKYFNLNRCHPFLRSMIFWCGYQYKPDKSPTLDLYMSWYARFHIKRYRWECSLEVAQALYLAFITYFFLGQTKFYLSILAHLTRITLALGYDRLTSSQRIPKRVAADASLLYSVVVRANLIVSGSGYKPCFIVNYPKIHQFNDYDYQLPQGVYTDKDIILAHCITNLTEYNDYEKLQIYYGYFQRRQPEGALRDEQKRTTLNRAEALFNTILQKYLLLKKQYPSHYEIIGDYINLTQINHLLGVYFVHIEPTIINNQKTINIQQCIELSNQLIQLNLKLKFNLNFHKNTILQGLYLSLKNLKLACNSTEIQHLEIVLSDIDAILNQGRRMDELGLIKTKLINLKLNEVK